MTVPYNTENKKGIPLGMPFCIFNLPSYPHIRFFKLFFDLYDLIRKNIL